MSKEVREVEVLIGFRPYFNEERTSYLVVAPTSGAGEWWQWWGGVSGTSVFDDYIPLKV